MWRDPRFRHTLNSWQVFEGLGWVTRGSGIRDWGFRIRDVGLEDWGLGYEYYGEGLAEAVGGDVSFVPAWSVGKS